MTRDETIATQFNALAHPRRARIFRLMAETPEIGRSLQSLQQATGYKDAPLLHHVRVMEQAGLIRRQRTGNTVSRKLTPGPLAAALGEANGILRHAASPVAPAA